MMMAPMAYILTVMNLIVMEVTVSVDQKVDLKSYGGTGYSFVLTQFVPLLKRKGVTRDQVHTLLVENPRRALTFAAPGPGGEQ